MLVLWFLFCIVCAFIVYPEVFIAQAIGGLLILAAIWIGYQAWEGGWRLVLWIVPRLPERIRRRIAAEYFWNGIKWERVK